jgi:hypothetical protein
MKVEKLWAPFHVVHSCDKFLQTFGISFFFWGTFYIKEFSIEHSFFQNAENLPRRKKKSLLPALFNDKTNICKKATEIEMIFSTKFSKKSPDRNIRHIFVKQHKSPMTSSHYIFLDSTPFSSFLDHEALVHFSFVFWECSQPQFSREHELKKKDLQRPCGSRTM